MNPENQENNVSERPKSIRILALIGVIAILGLIIAAVVVAVINFEGADRIVLGLFSASFFIGVMVYLAGLYQKLSKKNRDR
ncbi:MAG: hypothetical protein K5655_08025 [Lachnospiraceae bacterium]|nr:hypothetical protein [Lachnospiraceae bacterium]